MHNRNILIGYRLFFASLTLVAVVAQIAHLVGHDQLNPANFLSYFTNLSNIFASLVFIIGAFRLTKGYRPNAVDDVIRGASVLYMAITGVVYVFLLSGEDLGLLLPWVNVVLHFVMPAAVVLDWLYQPQRTTLVVRQILSWLVFPMLFLVYSLIRGPFVNWYPYPFLDPGKAGGYMGVTLYLIGILVILLVAGWLLMKAGNGLKRNVE